MMTYCVLRMLDLILELSSDLAVCFRSVMK